MEASAGTLTPPRALSGSNTRTSSQAPSVRRQETDDSEKAGRIFSRTLEDDPWAPCILTLDGGGIRGYSSLLILKALMHEVWLWERRLDDEERSQQGQYRPQQSSTYTSVTKADTHRSSKNGTREDNDRRRDSSEVLEHKDPDSAIDQVQQDKLASAISTTKAISEEELLPCHYFDFHYGTSTGGLIAMIIGRLRMTVAEALELYRQVGDDLFGKRRSHLPLRTKYHHEPLERAVREIVAKRCHEHSNCDGNDMHPWESDDYDKILRLPVPFHVDRPRVSHSCCLTATHDENISEAHLLRSYPHYYTEDAPNFITLYNEGADMLPIWKVGRATTAAPFYFEMVKTVVGGIERSFKDGGIRENNPSGAAMSEFYALYGGSDTKVPALLLSVGTGLPNQSQDGFASSWSGPLSKVPGVSKFLEKRAIISNLLIKYTEGEKQHHWMREHAKGEHTWYKRLNVSKGLETMPLDEWIKGDWQGQSNVSGGSSLSRMEDATADYLDRGFDSAFDVYAPPSVMISQAAEKLVRQRRARERMGGPRWDAFVGKHLPTQHEGANGSAG